MREDWKAATRALSPAGSVSAGETPFLKRPKISCMDETGAALSSGRAAALSSAASGLFFKPISSTARSASERLFRSS
jgi:hypothetical protein